METLLVRFLTAGALAATLLSGCIVIDLNGCGWETVKGSGKVVSETRQIADVNAIKLEGQGKITITRGETPSLEIRSDDNIIPHIETTVRNKKLTISHENKNLRPTTLTFYITVRDLRNATIAGSGEIRGDSRFVSDNFSAEISGSGSIDLEMETNRLVSEISGSGSIYLAGSTDHHRASITGSGKIYAFDMQSKFASVSITGSGDCLLTATDQLNAIITGSGDIIYKGHPHIEQTITGSGKVRNQN
jgi:hypothetical protein